jgi:hypothetical protein
MTSKNVHANKPHDATIEIVTAWTIRMLLLVAAAFVVIGGAAARAQIAEAYGTVAVDPLTNVELPPDPFPPNSQHFPSYTPVGFTIGGTLNFLNFAPVAVGVDASETVASGANLWLAGLRITVKLPALRIKPYFKLAVGEAHLHVPQSYSTSLPATLPVDTYIYNAALGVDYRLTHFVDVRLLEVGDGRTLGAGANNPTNLLTLNSGIVVHF